jgi:hypothetical protein
MCRSKRYRDATILEKTISSYHQAPERKHSRANVCSRNKRSRDATILEKTISSDHQAPERKHSRVNNHSNANLQDSGSA